MSKIKFVLTYDDWCRACEAMRQQESRTNDSELARITTKIIKLIINQVSTISYNPKITDEITKKRVQSILHERTFHALPHLKESATLDDCAFWIIDCLHQDELIVCVDSEALESDDYNVINGSNLLIITNASSTVLTDEYWVSRDFKASHTVSVGTGSEDNNAKSEGEQNMHTESLTTFMSRKDDECDTLLVLCSQGVIGRVYSGNRKGIADNENHTYLINLTNAPDASSWLLSSSAAPAILKTSEIFSVQQIMQTIQDHLALDQNHADQIKNTRISNDKTGKGTENNGMTLRGKISDNPAASSDDSLARKSANDSMEHEDSYLILLDTDHF